MAGKVPEPGGLCEVSEVLRSGRVNPESPGLSGETPPTFDSGTRKGINIRVRTKSDNFVARMKVSSVLCGVSP